MSWIKVGRSISRVGRIAFRPLLILLLQLTIFTQDSSAATPYTDIAEVAAGGGQIVGVYTCALSLSGGVRCWGVNDKGQLGNSSLVSSTVPVDVTGLTSGVSQISAGRAHTCAVTSGGGVKCWGDNTYGQLGDNSTTTSSSPVAVSGAGSGISKVYAGRDHTCALTSGGGIKCWGRNQTSQLGNSGSSTCGGENCSLVPLTVYASGMIGVAAGSYHTCAITSGGGAKCWGNNYYGQLGNNSVYDSSMPVNVFGLSSGIIQVTAGDVHSCALTSTGYALCWGINEFYELGFSSSENCAGLRCSKIPHNVTESNGVAAGSMALLSTGPTASHTCALTLSGGARCWGDNSSKELGNLETDDDCLASFDNCSRTPLTVSGNSSGLVHVSAGKNYACAVTTDGSVRCWGLGSYVPVDKIGVYDYYSISGSISYNSSAFSDVTVNGGALGNQSTAIDGSYSYSNIIEQTSYMITPSKAGYCFTPASAVGTLTGNATHSFSAFQCYVISGIVTEGYSPLSGVSMDGGALGYALTDSSGNYWFNRAPAGASYTITPSKTGYSFSPASRSGTANMDKSASFSAIHTLSGRVATSSNAPVAGVSVYWGLYGTKTTDASGNYSFPDVPHGTDYSLSIFKTGYTFSPSSPSGTVTSEAALNIVATPLVYTISGNLRNTASGPIWAYTVGGGALGNVTTNSLGHYSISNVPYGTAYTITPLASYYAFNPVSRSGTTTGNVTADFIGTHTYTLSGTILAAGQSLPGALVDGGALGTQTTNGAGQYQFLKVVEGTSYSLSPSKAGYSIPPGQWPRTIYNDTVNDFTATAFTPTPTVTPTQTNTASSTPTIPAPTAIATASPNLTPEPPSPTPAPTLDTAAPVVHALNASGKAGKTINLTYRVTEASGFSADSLRVLLNAKVLKRANSPSAAIPSGRIKIFKWNSKGKKKGSYQFCVQATDLAGNASSASCAKIGLK